MSARFSTTPKDASYPNDADGDALRRVAEWSNMSRPMDIDFTVDVPDKTRGEEMARLASQRGYKVVLSFDEPDQWWTCYCTKRIVPTYDAVVAPQRELDELSKPLGGHCDGWGTFGN